VNPAALFAGLAVDLAQSAFQKPKAPSPMASSGPVKVIISPRGLFRGIWLEAARRVS
jgi:hypothetical protein